MFEITMKSLNMNDLGKYSVRVRELEKTCFVILKPCFK